MGDRDLFNPYGEADPLSERMKKEAWSDEVRSPADGKSGMCPDRNAGDGLGNFRNSGDPISAQNGEKVIF